MEAGETLPLYEEVKRNIYKLFEELKNMSSLCLVTRNKNDYYICQNTFKEKFIKSPSYPFHAYLF
jgi:hypothetical protein